MESEIQVATRPRRRGRPKVLRDEDRREIIVARAAELFVEFGYARATTEKIAARCRISKQTLYRLFPGKLAIFAAMVDANRNVLIAAPEADESQPLAVALEKMFRADLDPDVGRRLAMFLRCAIADAARFPEVREVLRIHGGDRTRADLANWLWRQAAAGRIVIDDAEAMAQILMDMVFGAVLLKTPGELKWKSGPDRATHIKRCVSVFLHGVETGHSGQFPAVSPHGTLHA